MVCNKMQQAIQAMQTTKKIGSLINMIDEHSVCALGNKKISEKNNQIKQIRKLCTELTTLQAPLVKLINNIAPMEGCEYAATRLINAGTKNPAENAGKTQKIRSVKTEKKHGTRTQANLRYTLPKNGTEYTVEEAVTECLNNKLNVQKCINDLIELKYIPCSLSQMKRILHRAKNEELPTKFLSKRGRKPLLTVQELQQHFTENSLNKGFALDRDNVQHMLIKSKVDNHVASGLAYAEEQTVSDKSTRKYFALALGSVPDVKIRNTVQQKNRTRVIAERSLRSCVSYLVSVAVSHYVIGQTGNDVTDVKHATPGAIKFRDMVSKVNNNAEVYPVKPWLLTSTDDSTLFVFKGIARNKKRSYGVIQDDETKGRLSFFSQDVGGTAHLNGLRVRHTHTVNALGNSAPIYITVYGLTERELCPDKCPSGRLCVEVPGLCHGGGQDIRHHQTKGYIIFLRARTRNETNAIETINFRHYHKEVYLPFMEGLKKYYSTSPDDSVDFTSGIVSWYDGGPSQLSLLTSEDIQEEDELNQITSMKHAAATTAVQQAMDICPIFKLIREACNRATAEGLPDYGFKNIVKKVFKQLKDSGVLCLKPTAEAALIDHICSYPCVFQT